MLCLLHHLTVLLFRERRLKFTFKFQRLIGCRISIPNQIGESLKFQFCLVILFFHRICLHVDDQDHFLTEIVKGDHLIKQHQIDILERILIGFF